MKFSALSIAALATAATSVSAANYTLSEPWSTTIWTGGENGTVAWTSVGDDAATKKCEIHLLTGSATTATFVRNLTDNGNLVPCNFTRANLHPLPDYVSGDYFIRLGENGGDTAYYAYSGYFKYIGNGTATYEGATPAAAAVVSSAPVAAATPAAGV